MEGAEENSVGEKLTRVSGLDAFSITIHEDASAGRGRRGVGKGRWGTLMCGSAAERLMIP